MQAAGVSKSHGTAQDRAAAQVHLAGFQHNRLIERRMLPPVVFTDKNPQQDGFAWNLHRGAYPSLKLVANACPSHTPNRHNSTEAPTFDAALSHCPSRARFSVSRLNVENVVKPPQTPGITNWRRPGAANTRPSGPVMVAKKPINEQPITFTARVPHGKVSPACLARKP